jgi:hypothetical protein
MKVEWEVYPNWASSGSPMNQWKFILQAIVAFFSQNISNACSIYGIKLNMGNPFYLGPFRVA